IRIGAVSSHYGEGGLRAREHDGGPVVRGAGAAAAAADGFRWRKEAAEDAAAAAGAGRHGEAGQQASGAAASATGAVVAVPVAGGCGAVCAAEEGGGGDGLGDGVGAVTTLGFALHFPLSGPSRMTSPSSVLCESNKVRNHPIYDPFRITWEKNAFGLQPNRAKKGIVSPCTQSIHSRTAPFPSPSAPLSWMPIYTPSPPAALLTSSSPIIPITIAPVIMASGKIMAAGRNQLLLPPPIRQFKYSKRVVLKSILDREDKGLAIAGQRVVVGGWVNSRKERAEDDDAPFPTPPAQADDVLVQYVPFLRPISSVPVVVGGGARATAKDKHVLVYLLINDGSCSTNLQVLTRSSLPLDPNCLSAIRLCCPVEACDGLLHVHPRQCCHRRELHLGRRRAAEDLDTKKARSRAHSGEDTARWGRRSEDLPTGEAATLIAVPQRPSPPSSSFHHGS
ncbi:hypothetical protein BHE74_00010603, partial [Ensete ventricosum]